MPKSSPGLRDQPLGAARDAGGRGRIRTSVARKERQIYSLLVLATHPPVRRTASGTQESSPANPNRTEPDYCTGHSPNAERARVQTHQPCSFLVRGIGSYTTEK